MALTTRLKRLETIIKKYKSEYMGKSGFINPKKYITYKQFIDTLEYQTLTGQDYKAHQQLNKLYAREKQYH